MKNITLQTILVLIAAVTLSAFSAAGSLQAQIVNPPDSGYPSYSVGGFIQQQFIVDETENSATRFATHRARIGIQGNVTENIRVNFVGGFVEPPQATPRLVNAFVDFNIHPLFNIRTGQFLVPFGLEGPEVITFNPTIERSTAIRRLNTFTMFRDVGVQVSGSDSGFSYAVALVNGSGANNAEQIEPKDIMGRIGYQLTECLNIGVSGHYGNYQPDPSVDNNEARYRFGADLSFNMAPFFLRGEYIFRQDERPSADALNMQGFYALAGYNITDQIQGIVRFEYYDPNTDASDNELTIVTLGANYQFMGNTRISANYEIRDDQLNPALKNVFTLQMQVAL